MANIFAITTVAEDIKADAGGKAGAVFTVTNTSNKPVRGIAKTKALGNTEQNWLDVEGEMERDFAGNGTQQFTVTFARPPSPVAPGSAPATTEKFPFRLDIASALNPDEQFTEGPIVNVEVKGAGAPPVKKPFPLWIILVIAGVGLLVIGLILFLVFQKGCNSPAQSTANFEGIWRPDNTDPNFTFIASMEIKQSGKDIQVKLACRLIVCDDWGVGQGKVDGDSATVEWKNDAVTGKTKITLLEPSRIMNDGSFEPKSGMLHPTVKAVFLKN